MKFELKDGRIVEIVPLSGRIPIRTLRRYINDLVREDTYIIGNEPKTFGEEKAWRDSMLAGVRNHDALHFCAFSGNRIVASCEARRGRGRCRHNATLGIAVSKDFRGVGLGESLLAYLISEVKSRFRPRNIHLNAFAANAPALSLYRKLGFIEVCRFPGWINYKGAYIDSVEMVLQGRAR